MREVRSRPLIGHAIDQAVKAEFVPICVSSDCPQVRRYVGRYYCDENNVVTYIDRPPYLAADDTPKIKAIVHALKYMNDWATEPFDTVIDLDVCNPMRKSEMIHEALGYFQARKPFTLVSVTPARRNPFRNQLEEIDYGLYQQPCGKGDKFALRQNAPVVWDVNAAIYIYSADYLLSHCNPKVITNRTAVYEMPPETYCDIDNEFDIYTVQELMRKYNY
jgi:N-acylneuraminate cytidylyltransferase/CMP-N,N'-diacetyllegionaminic acid synthase